MIDFPYKIKNTTANTTYVEPYTDANIVDQNNICDQLSQSYTELNEIAMDNVTIFERYLKHSGRKPNKVTLKNFFKHNFKELTVSPNPKNPKGLKKQKINRLINGMMYKLYRVRTDPDKNNLSIQIIDQHNKMMSLIQGFLDVMWNTQDHSFLQLIRTPAQVKQQEQLKDNMKAYLENLKINAYNQGMLKQTEQNEKLIKTGLFE